MSDAANSKRQEAKDRAYEYAEAMCKISARLHQLGCDVLSAEIECNDPRIVYEHIAAALKDARVITHEIAQRSDAGRGTPASTSDESLEATFLACIR